MAFTARAQGNLSLAVGGGQAVTRARVLADLGLALDDAVFMSQVHGASVRRVSRADRGRGATDHTTAVAGVDALVTTDERVALVVLAADCVPLLLAAPGAGVAAVHAGRAGVAAGVVPAAVAALAGAVDCSPQDLHAVIGPAIAGCCYEVPESLASEVVAKEPAARAVTSWGTPALDLPRAVEAQLSSTGAGHVEHAGSGCTRCDPERWFSHRAWGGGVADAGRQAGVVALGVAPPPSGGEPSLD